MTKLIAIDNGHGLNTNGKRTFNFTDGTKSPITGQPHMREWEFNHRVAQLLDIELKRCGFRTIMVSDTQDDTSITVRARRASQAGADVLVSIHANAFGTNWNSANGVETLVCGTESTRIGKLIQEEMVTASKLTDRKTKDGCWLGLVKNAGNMPVVLTEHAFMSNLSEAKLLMTEEFRKLSAVAIAKGICRAYGVKYVPETIKSTQPHKGDEDKLNLTNYQWGELEKNIKMLLTEGIITSETWVTKAQNRTLTVSEVCWLNNMVLMRLRK